MSGRGLYVFYVIENRQYMQYIYNIEIFFVLMLVILQKYQAQGVLCSLKTLNKV